jgi:hypothetical protein
MNKQMIYRTAATLLLCLLAGLVASRLSHWNWRRDGTGGPQAGLIKRGHAKTVSFRFYELLADARTAVEALRYVLRPEMPKQTNELADTGIVSTNPIGKHVSLQPTFRAKVSKKRIAA